MADVSDVVVSMLENRSFDFLRIWDVQMLAVRMARPSLLEVIQVGVLLCL